MGAGAVATGWDVRAADASARREPVVMTRWAYEPATLLKGFLSVWRRTGDRRHLDHVRSNVDRLLEGGGIATYSVEKYDLDSIAPGPLLLALWRETREARYRDAAHLLREQLRTQPRTASGGFWHKRIYRDQMWLDGIYMAAPFYLEYGVLFEEPAAFDDVARQIALVAEHARDERTGLLRHAWDESRAQRWADASGRSPNVWGRALGWYAMALVDVLELLPDDAAQRAPIAAVLGDVADAVVRAQDPTGCWWQVLDAPGREGNYLEASASCMFAYALAKGARLGHLGRGHLDAARRAHRGVLDRYVRIGDGEVELAGTCAGVGLGPYMGDREPYRDGSYDYYVGVPTLVNDHRGVGPFLMASAELEAAGDR